MEVLDYTFERRLELEKDDSFREGQEIGIQQGVTRGINETITRMRDNGVTDDEIARLTGFDMETISKSNLK